MAEWRQYGVNRPEIGEKFVIADLADGCSAGIYVMLDDGYAHCAEDGELAIEHLWDCLWMPLPPDFPIRFMEVTEDDWY